ncbi:site-specific integrase [uncultured Parasutterella sp.]|uniref:tyrosine-type recombinase/integrase n=1 Tax=uncultured Parasutterella sp. TaxID=1263098 RepID=UPI0025972D62|nr:site-specific integrase [uncultured Parasutterella sp.]
MAPKFTLKKILSLADGRYSTDEKGLSLKVHGVRRSWIYRYTFDGKRQEVNIGNARDVSHQKAIERVTKIKLDLIDGKDPKAKRESSQAGSAIKFEDFYESAINEIASVKLWRNKKHAQQWLNTVRDYAVPGLSGIEVRNITVNDIARVLKPIWTTKTETASRVRGRLESIFSYAILTGVYTQANPAVWKGALEMLLPPVSKVKRVVHHESMSHAELRGKIGLLYPPTGPARALIVFTILAACRIGESAPAKWDEIDFEKKIWTVPPERRKDGKSEGHRVPLTAHMIDLLNRLPRKSEYIFASHEGHVSRESPRVLIQRLLKTNATMHGMRSTFRDWAAENLIHDVLAEKQLMHATGSEVVQAYQRSDLLEKRRPMMEQWDSYLFSSSE